jgi:putative Ca2+/H+ antiporter (TMEM165/GDT1 family)
MLGPQAMAQAIPDPARPLTTTPPMAGVRRGHASPRPERTMQAFLVSTGVVALAEIGDKTQLLAFVLAARYRRPWPIVAGILVATLANHALAGAAGAWLMAAVPANALRWALGLSFLAMAAWALVPDRLDDGDTPVRTGRGVFAVTLLAFFLAEMGDKTQLATIALAATFAAPFAVVAGTTLGMMLANVPAVLLGERLLRKVPLRLVHATAAAIFAALGAATLLGAGAGLGL